MTTERTIGIGIVGSGLMARSYAETLAKYVRGCRFAAVAGGRRAPQLAQNYVELPFMVTQVYLCAAAYPRSSDKFLRRSAWAASTWQRSFSGLPACPCSHSKVT
jgi:hypothetical protein